MHNLKSRPKYGDKSKTRKHCRAYTTSSTWNAVYLILRFWAVTFVYVTITTRTDAATVCCYFANNKKKHAHFWMFTNRSWVKWIILLYCFHCNGLQWERKRSTQMPCRWSHFLLVFIVCLWLSISVSSSFATPPSIPSYVLSALRIVFFLTNA